MEMTVIKNSLITQGVFYYFKSALLPYYTYRNSRLSRSTAYYTVIHT